MAADTVNVAIKKRHFDGGDQVGVERRRVGEANSRSLAQILRNLVDELTEREQHGAATIANAAASATITFSPAMPDTSYDIFTQLREVGTGKLAGAVDLKHLVVLDADKAAASFVVKMDPAATNAGEAIDFYWFARSRTRINTKG